jgi:ABC-type glutathione transport system ATPase component
VSLVEISDLRVVYPAPATTLRRSRRDVTVVDGVDLTVGIGETVGLVGSSGAGKTSIAKAVLHLVRAQGGRITVGEFDVTGFDRRAPLAFRKDVQMVFQHPGSSLNPALTVAETLAEPLRLHFHLRGAHVGRRVAELLEAVELPAGFTTRRPQELSVGERQRVAVARALATEPRLIVLDEPVSALDATTRSRLVSTLEDLQRATGVTYVLITHDIALARRLCGRISVLHRGRVVEAGRVERVCDDPQHPYTQLLLASILDPDPTTQRAARDTRRRLASAWAADLTGAAS